MDGPSNVQSIRADGRSIAFVCALVLHRPCCAGLLPAISSTSKGAIAALQASSRNAAGSLSRTALRKTLLTVEIAATVAVNAAGLLLKSFWRLRTTDVGCATDNVLTMGYSLPAKKYDSPQKVNAFNETLLEQVRTMPGVRSAGLGSMVPGAGAGEDDAFTIPEHPPIAPSTAPPDALYSDGRSRIFQCIANTAAERAVFYQRGSRWPLKDCHHQPPSGAAVFPGRKPVGQASPRRSIRNADYEIVGIVADTLYQVGQPDKATMYFPVLNGGSVVGSLTLALRTAADPLTISVPVQKLIAELDPQLPVSDVLYHAADH